MAESEYYKRLIEEVRASFGAAPRRHFFYRHRVGIPYWAHGHPPLEDVVKHQSHLLRHGQIVWGALVQANSRMFSRGSMNAPGSLLYSRHADMVSRPHILTSTAGNLFDVKGDAGAGGGVQSIADMLGSEFGSTRDLPVPLGMTQGIECYVTNVLFERRHLPGRKLNGSLYPILVDLGMSAAIVVPHWHWPKELQAPAERAGRMGAGR